MLNLLRRRSAPRGRRAPIYRAVAHAVAAHQADRAILLDARRGRYFGMDEVGVAIWGRLAGGTTLARLVDELEEEYAVPREILQRDAASFLERLARARLVVAE